MPIHLHTKLTNYRLSASPKTTRPLQRNSNTPTRSSSCAKTTLQAPFSCNIFIFPDEDWLIFGRKTTYEFLGTLSNKHFLSLLIENIALSALRRPQSFFAAATSSKPHFRRRSSGLVLSVDQAAGRLKEADESSLILRGGERTKSSEQSKHGERSSNGKEEKQLCGHSKFTPNRLWHGPIFSPAVLVLSVRVCRQSRKRDHCLVMIDGACVSACACTKRRR